MPGSPHPIFQDHLPKQMVSPPLLVISQPQELALFQYSLLFLPSPPHISSIIKSHCLCFLNKPQTPSLLSISTALIPGQPVSPLTWTLLTRVWVNPCIPCNPGSAGNHCQPRLDHPLLKTPKVFPLLHCGSLTMPCCSYHRPLTHSAFNLFQVPPSRFTGLPPVPAPQACFRTRPLNFLFPLPVSLFSFSHMHLKCHVSETAASPSLQARFPYTPHLLLHNDFPCPVLTVVHLPHWNIHSLRVGNLSLSPSLE